MARIILFITSLLERAKSIIFNPSFEWELIEAETLSIGDIYKGFILPLAAIDALFSVVGASFVGQDLAFVGKYYVPLPRSLFQGAVCYALTLVGVYLLGRVINYSATRFGGEEDGIQAFKLAAYSYTPVWIFSVFSIIPEIKDLSLIGLIFAVYLLYLGLPVLMKSSPDRRISHTILVAFFTTFLFFTIAVVRSIFLTAPNPWV